MEMGSEKLIKGMLGGRSLFALLVIILAILLPIPFASILTPAQEELEIEAATHLFDISCSMLVVGIGSPTGPVSEMQILRLAIYQYHRRQDQGEVVTKRGGSYA